MNANQLEHRNALLRELRQVRHRLAGIGAPTGEVETTIQGLARPVQMELGCVFCKKTVLVEIRGESIPHSYLCEDCGPTTKGGAVLICLD